MSEVGDNKEEKGIRIKVEEWEIVMEKRIRKKEMEDSDVEGDKKGEAQKNGRQSDEEGNKESQ